MAKKKKNTNKGKALLVVIILVIALGVFVFFQTRPKLMVVSVVDRIEEYDYYMESNYTKTYKEYFEELKKYIKEKNNIEEDYAKIIAKLFITDYYTLNNKVTNKDIGGVQYVHPNLKNDFINAAGNSIYKYVKSNLYKNRKQNLPEVEKVEVLDTNNIKYNRKDYKDDNGYIIKTKISYVKDYDYPKEVNLILIHDNEKLVVVEVE